MKITCLLFDLDGTLFNFHKSEIVAIQAAFRVYGIILSKEDIDLYISINAKLWEDFEKGKIKRDDIFVNRFKLFLSSKEINISAKHINEMYLYFLGRFFYLEKGALDLLNKLYGKYKLYIVTNGVRTIQLKKIKGTHIDHYFTDAFISESIGHSKPNASFFNYCFDKINCTPSECLIIGDSLLSDIYGGSNVGIHTCWLIQE